MTTKAISRAASIEVQAHAGGAPDRPRAPIQIGGKTYNARAPKFSVWWDVARMVEQSQLGIDVAQSLDDTSEPLTPEQRQALDESVMTGFGQLHIAIIYGAEDETGRVRGGFLRRCLTREDWEELMLLIDDDDSDLDLPDLYTAALELQQTFGPWFEQRAATMGLPVPEKNPKAKGAKSKPRAN